MHILLTVILNYILSFILALYHTKNVLSMFVNMDL
jgi:hypothetical protein